MGYFSNLKSFYRQLPFYYTRQLLILVILKMASSSFLIVSPFLSKLYVDDAFINKDLHNFLRISIWGAVIFILSALFLALEDIAKNRTKTKLKLNVADRFIRKHFALELDFFYAKSTGENAYRLADIDLQTDFLAEHAPRFFVDLLKLIVILGISLWVNVPMTVFLLVLSPLFLLNSFFIQKKLSPLYREIWRCGVRISQKTHEAFSRILIIKALGLETFQRHAYLKSLIANLRLGISSFRWSVINTLSSSFLAKLIYGLVTLFGGWLIIQGGLTIGSYAAAMLYLIQLGSLLESLSHRFEYIARESVVLEKFLEIMDREPGIQDLPEAKSLSRLQGDIRFKNVTFGYQQKELIFKGLSFNIPPFAWVAVAGPSGCGKSTLVSLILRLYEPRQGELFLDGVDLKKVRLQDLRKNIAIATQQPLLFDISIQENIKSGLKHLTPRQMQEAISISCLEDWIKELPRGLETLIGEDACLLSHGIRQRVALARAIIRKPALLILDEAISSVDALTQERILRVLRQSREGLSTIIISHQLSSVQDADRIYFLSGGNQNGRMEEGSHAELMLQSPGYREFFKL